MSKEAHARIKINKLLEGSGWRFFDDLHGKANISLEPNVSSLFSLAHASCLNQTKRIETGTTP